MGLYTILRNSQLEIQLAEDYQDNGWSLVNGNAIHSSLNEGSIRNTVIKTDPEQIYKVVFTVSDLNGGSLIIYIGGTPITITDNGTYVREVEAIDDTGLVVWSDANVTLSPVSIYMGSEEYNTMLFSPKGVLDTYASFTSDYMIKMLGSFYSFKNGELWRHNKNEVRNSFYGQSHKSIVKFILNPEPKIVKNLSNIKMNGNRAWDLLEVFVEPYEGKPNGQKSRITKNRFENLQGDFHAAFLKDMSDPRFQNQLQALFEGADLQGKIVTITMEIEGETEMRLVNIDFTYTHSNYTF